MSQCIQASVV